MVFRNLNLLVMAKNLVLKAVGSSTDESSTCSESVTPYSGDDDGNDVLGFGNGLLTQEVKEHESNSMDEAPHEAFASYPSFGKESEGSSFCSSNKPSLVSPPTPVKPVARPYGHNSSKKVAFDFTEKMGSDAKKGFSVMPRIVRNRYAEVEERKKQRRLAEEKNLKRMYFNPYKVPVSMLPNLPQRKPRKKPIYPRRKVMSSSNVSFGNFSVDNACNNHQPDNRFTMGNNGIANISTNTTYQWGPSGGSCTNETGSLNSTIGT